MFPLGYQVPLCFFFFYSGRYASGPATISWVINIKIPSSSFPKATETTAVKSCNPPRETVSLESLWWVCSLSKILGFVLGMTVACILLMQVYKMIKTCHKMPLFWHILPLLFLFSSSPDTCWLLCLSGLQGTMWSCSHQHHTQPLWRLPGAGFPLLEASVMPLMSPIAMPLALLFQINTWCSR